MLQRRNKENITPTMLFSIHPFGSIRTFALITAVHTCPVAPLSLKRDGGFIFHLQLAGYKLLPTTGALPKEGACNYRLCLSFWVLAKAGPTILHPVGDRSTPLPPIFAPDASLRMRHTQKTSLQRAGGTHKCHWPLHVLWPSGHSLRSFGIQIMVLWVNWSRTEKPQSYRSLYLMIQFPLLATTKTGCFLSHK